MDQRAQDIFDKLGQMAMRELSTPEAADAIGSAAQEKGAAPAIVEALQAVVGGITEAARAAKVEIDPAAVQQAQYAIAGVLATMMVESGLADDPDIVMAEVQSLMGQGEAGEVEGPGEMPMDEEQPPPGALAAMGGM